MLLKRFPIGKTDKARTIPFTCPPGRRFLHELRLGNSYKPGAKGLPVFPRVQLGRIRKAIAIQIVRTRIKTQHDAQSGIGLVRNNTRGIRAFKKNYGPLSVGRASKLA